MSTLAWTCCEWDARVPCYARAGPRVSHPAHKPDLKQVVAVPYECLKRRHVSIWVVAGPDWLIVCTGSDRRTGRDHMQEEDSFGLLCDAVSEAFPVSAPEIVAESAWGDYGDAIRVFSQLQSNWTCDDVMRNRSVIGFISDAAFRFLLPRFIRCSVDDEGINPDIFDYLIFGLDRKRNDFATLLSARRASVLIPVLEYLLAEFLQEGCTSTTISDGMGRILTALESRSMSEN